MASQTVPRPRAHFSRLHNDGLRAALLSGEAAFVARSMRASAEQQRAWASRTIEETGTAVARSRALLRRRLG